MTAKRNPMEPAPPGPAARRLCKRRRRIATSHKGARGGRVSWDERFRVWGLGAFCNSLVTCWSSGSRAPLTASAPSTSSAPSRRADEKLAQIAIFIIFLPRSCSLYFPPSKKKCVTNRTFRAKGQNVAHKPGVGFPGLGAPHSGVSLNDRCLHPGRPGAAGCPATLRMMMRTCRCRLCPLAHVLALHSAHLNHSRSRRPLS